MSGTQNAIERGVADLDFKSLFLLFISSLILGESAYADERGLKISCERVVSDLALSNRNVNLKRKEDDRDLLSEISRLSLRFAQGILGGEDISEQIQGFQGALERKAMSAYARKRYEESIGFFKRLVYYQILRHSSRQNYEHVKNGGFNGIYEAIDRFDSVKFETTFSTYAYHWISEGIRKAESQDRQLIRISPDDRAKSRKICRFAQEFYQTHGRRPSEEEISFQTGIAPQEVFRLQSRSLKPSSSVFERDGESKDLFEFLSDESSESLESSVEKKQDVSVLIRALDPLTEKQREIIKKLYAVGGEVPAAT